MEEELSSSCFFALSGNVSVRVSENLGTAYQPLFGSLYTIPFFVVLNVSRKSKDRSRSVRVHVFLNTLNAPLPVILNVSVKRCRRESRMSTAL